MNIVAKPLRDEDRHRMRETRLTRARQRLKKEIACPQLMGEFVTSDVTISRVTQMLMANPRGLVILRDELAGCIENIGKRMGADHWLSIHSGAELRISRANARTLVIPRPVVSIFGGFQPGVLQRMLLSTQNRENGLAARFLLATPPHKPIGWSDETIPVALSAYYASAFARLLDLPPLLATRESYEPVPVPLSREAQRAFAEFVERCASKEDELSTDLHAVWSKLRAYAARLALVLEFAKWSERDVEPPAFVADTTMCDAITLTEWFGRQATGTYDLPRRTEDERRLEQVLNVIQNREGSVTARDLRQYVRFVADSAHAERILRRLVEFEFGEWAPPTNVGRPTRKFVLRVYQIPKNAAIPDLS